MFILETRELTKSFGRLAALYKLNLKIKAEEITSLIGPNGAGKTTFYNVVTGRFPPSSGYVFFKGENITGFPPHRILKRGIARSFQITSIFMDLSVLNNIRASVIARSGARMNVLRRVGSFDSLYEGSMEILRFLGLEDKRDVLCSKLSHGDMRTVDIGIALACKPDLIFLDEPTAGMTPEETRKMVGLIKKLSEQTKTTFFVTEHDMNVVFSISDRIIVLHQGQVLADGTPKEIRDNGEVKKAYLGGLTDA
jgi:branched-chain amino acid transport system ATP-binding protein